MGTHPSDRSVEGDNGGGHSLGRWIWVAPAVGIVACLASLGAVGDLRGHPRATIVILLIAAAFYVLACTCLARCWSGLSAMERRRALGAVVVLALAARVIMLFVPPSLSDDVYRYRWDGRVQAAGYNPYAYPPADPRLAALRDSHWESINYPRIRTIYPPLAEALFRVAYLAGDGLLPYQLLAVVGDIALIALVFVALSRWGRPRWRLALYALHPLPIVEFASSAHYDAWTIAAVMLALLAHGEGRRVVSTLGVAAGILLKAWPLVFAPLLLRRRHPAHLLLFAVVVAAAYLPYRDAGLAILQPWMDFTGRWLFNDAALAVLRGLTGDMEIAKALGAMLGTGLLLVLWRRDIEPVRGGYWLLIATILLMPAIHPWYLLWALPLAVIGLDLGWIALTLLAPLAYWILVGAAMDSNLWVEPPWVRFVVYLPAAAIWMTQAWRRGPAAPGIGVRSDPRTLVGSNSPVT